MTRLLAMVLLAATVTAACGNDEALSPAGPDLDTVVLPDFVEQVESSTRPIVLNLWASWCIPCRSEAPLLREAHATFGDEVRFLGVATEDAMADSLAFIEEFGIEFENLSDRPGSVKGWVGAIGLPVTVFILPGGEILRTHFGVIDDQALALGIDDLLATG